MRILVNRAQIPRPKGLSCDASRAAVTRTCPWIKAGAWGGTVPWTVLHTAPQVTYPFHHEVLPVFQGLSPTLWIKSTALKRLLCAPAGLWFYSTPPVHKSSWKVRQERREREVLQRCHLREWLLWYGIRVLLPSFALGNTSFDRSQRDGLTSFMFFS